MSDIDRQPKFQMAATENEVVTAKLDFGNPPTPSNVGNVIDEPGRFANV